MRWACGLLLLVGSVAAQEPDGAIASRHRWTGPRGCASGSFRSRARPVVTEVEEAWSSDQGPILTSPVHWDGIGFVVVGGKKVRLLAFELATGKPRASKTLDDFVKGSGLFVSDGQALVQTGAAQISGYRLSGASLRQTWRYRGPSVPEKPMLQALHGNELYCYLGDKNLDTKKYGESSARLACVRPGAPRLTWHVEVPLNNPCRPVIHGPYVFVAGESGAVFRSKELNRICGVALCVYRRADGRLVGKLPIGQVLAKGPSNFTLSVLGNTAFLRSSWPFLGVGGNASYAMIPIKADATGVSSTGEIGLANYDLPPVQTTLGTVVRWNEGGKRDWRLAKKHKFWTITTEHDQPDLFKDHVAPTVLGEILYFGSWAMDIETQEILWRLPVKRVDYAVVPADGLLLVVEDGKMLRAFRGSLAR